MHRRFYILSKHDMPTLRSGAGNLILEDIIDLASEQTTRIVDNENNALDMRLRFPELRFTFVIEVRKEK